MVKFTISVLHKMASISGFTEKWPIRVNLDMGIIDNHQLKHKEANYCDNAYVH